MPSHSRAAQREDAAFFSATSSALQELNSRLAPPREMTTARYDHSSALSTNDNDCANKAINSSFKFLTKPTSPNVASPDKHSSFCVLRRRLERPIGGQNHARQSCKHNYHPQSQNLSTTLLAAEMLDLGPMINYARTTHWRAPSAITTNRRHKRRPSTSFSGPTFAIFCFAVLFTLLASRAGGALCLQEQASSSSVMSIQATSNPAKLSSEPDSKHQSADADATSAATTTNNNNNNNNNYNGDTPASRRMSAQFMSAEQSQQQQQQQPAIEQVAKAEALTAPNQAAPAPQAAALLQPNPAKLFEVCKSQVRSGQQLTNLSQIVFQPSDTCSTWSKMLRTSGDQASQQHQTSESYPWHYIEQLNLAYNNLSVLHDSSGMSRLVNLLDLRITHNQLSRCEESSLVGLQRLQVLDLSHNRLVALPAKFFQPVRSTIKKLNLSFNSISVLVPNLFELLAQLEYLDLSHNDITSHWINERLFKNLTQLRYLDLSFNKLTVFGSAATFGPLQQLETLSLQHNELRQVPDTIQHLRHLSSLDLSQNLIQDITNASYLSNCRLLFNLNLESNLLENVTRDAFSDLPALKVLNLANNRIHHLDQQAFDYVPDLHALRMDSNGLTDFGQAFVNLRFLLMLNISSNRISSFDYAHIPLGLQWLDLHSNRIDKLNNFYFSPSAQQQFATTTSSNDISSQQQQPSIGQQWQSLLRLTTLDASYNLIKELDNTSLPESLETVQLNNNQIRTIASHTFSNKSNLTRINLSNNQLSSLPFDAMKLVSHQQNQRDINLQLLAASTQQQQQQQAKFVDVYLANNPFVCNCSSGWLSQLLLASSNLMQGPTSIASTSAQAGALPRDHIFTSTYSMVLTRQLPRVADAHLINCHLPFGRQTPFHAAAGISSSAAPATMSAPAQGSPSPVSSAHAHELHLWSPVLAANQLAALHHGAPPGSSHHLLHALSTSASTAAILSSATTPLILKQSELLSSVHLCPYKSHCFALCYCCDFDACDCEMSCPENCSCYYDQTWSTNIVDCSANNQINGISSQTRFAQMMMMMGGSAGQHHHNYHHQHPQHYNHRQQQAQQLSAAAAAGQQPRLVRFMNIPEKIPMDVTELYLDGLELLHLRGNALIGRRNLKTLFLNNSQLYSIEPKALATQKSLRILQLNSNYLSQLIGHEFEQQAELRELYLAHNRLSSIANGTFAGLKSLQILHLQNNHLYHFDLWSNLAPSGLVATNRLVSLNLGQNPWSCQCDLVEPMLRWLQANVKHLHDRKSISCQYNATSTLHLLPPSSSSTSTPPSSLNMLTGGATSLQAGVVAAINENYPMFDMRLCLNHTVYPAAVVNLNQQQQQQFAQQMPDSASEQANNNYNPYKSLRGAGAAQDQQQQTASAAAVSSLGEDPLLVNGSYNPGFQPPPNDEPFSSGATSTARSQQHFGDYDPLQQQQQQFGQVAPHGVPFAGGYQFGVPQQPQTTGANSAPSVTSTIAARYQAPLLTPSFIFGAATMLCVTLIAVVSLIHHRRSMRAWFYTNHGLNLFASSAAKAAAQQQQQQHHHHHHKHVGSLSSSAKQNLSHQYAGAASSAGSTGSSSAASTNLSQTLFHNNNHHHHHHQTSTMANTSNSGLVTTPLIVTNTNQVMNSAAITTTTTTSYNDDDKLYDVYVTYSKFDEQFVNDFIAPELEYGQPSYSEWMQYEFRMAHLEALKGTNYKQRLVFVLLGQLPSFAAADAELLLWLKSCTCIGWGDKMFWQRLRFALPESAQARQQQQYGGSSRYQTMAPALQSDGGGAKLSAAAPSAGGAGAGKRNLLGVNSLLKSAGGFLTGGGGGLNASAGLAMGQQQHTRRPLPMQPQARDGQQAAASSQTSLYQAPPDEHHYAHLTPSTMVQQQQQQHTYHQPIYGDLNQQQQQQQQQRDSVPVHI